VSPDTHVFFPDENLERLALRLSSGLYADKATYDRLVRDVTLIRERNPALKSIGYRIDHDVRVLRVSFQPLTFWLARLSLYGHWNCLNRFLGADIVFHPNSTTPSSPSRDSNTSDVATLASGQLP
jgi:hypothetical protein